MEGITPNSQQEILVDDLKGYDNEKIRAMLTDDGFVKKGDVFTAEDYDVIKSYAVNLAQANTHLSAESLLKRAFEKRMKHVGKFDVEQLSQVALGDIMWNELSVKDEKK